MQNGATVTNAVDGTVTITEGGETEQHVFTNNLITLTSDSSATYAFTPAVAFNGAVTTAAAATFGGATTVTGTYTRPAAYSIVFTRGASKGLALLKSLKDQGVQVEYPMDQTCCGLPAKMMAEKAVAREVALQYLAAMDPADYD